MKRICLLLMLVTCAGCETSEQKAQREAREFILKMDTEPRFTFEKDKK